MPPPHGAALSSQAVYASVGVAARLLKEDLRRILHRHHCGDWGDLGDGDKRANEEAPRSDERILSRYDLECGSFCIVTEADRSTTQSEVPCLRQS